MQRSFLPVSCAMGGASARPRSPAGTRRCRAPRRRASRPTRRRSATTPRAATISGAQRVLGAAEVLVDDRRDHRQGGDDPQRGEEERQRVGDADLAGDRPLAGRVGAHELDLRRGAPAVSPRAVLMNTGKNITTATTAWLDRGERLPNHALAIGASAMIGIALSAAASGVTVSSAVRKRVVTSAATTPTMTPSARPDSTTNPVRRSAVTIAGRCSTRLSRIARGPRQQEAVRLQQRERHLPERPAARSPATRGATHAAAPHAAPIPRSDLADLGDAREERRVLAGVERRGRPGRPRCAQRSARGAATSPPPRWTGTPPPGSSG